MTSGVPRERIGFKRHLRAEVVAGDAVYLFSERGVTALEGERIEAVAPLLDGTRDLQTLLRETATPGISLEQLYGLISRLATAGLVGHRSPAEVSDEPAYTYWEAAGLDPGAAVSAASASVQLLTTGSVDRSRALRTFEAAGLAVAAPGINADLSVVLCDDYLSPELADVDASHRRAGRPWLLARPVGERVWIGPVFQPGTDGFAYWHCLAHRLWGHRPAEAHVQTSLGRRRPVARPAASITPLMNAALSLIAVEAAKWLADYRYRGQNCVWTLDSLDLQGQRHEVRKRPQCRSCGDTILVRAQARRPVLLSPRPKASRSGGGHRALAPEQVLDRYQHLISPVSGVVKEIRRDHRGPAFLNVFQSGPMQGRAGGVEGLRSALGLQSGGKGVTAIHAQASALCEALERHCATFQGDEEILRSSYASLGDRAIHPDSCQLFHQRQFDERETWNDTHGPFQYVCEPFDEKAELDWTPVWSLTEQRHRLLPTGMLYFGAPRDPGPLMVRADSNGNAAGASLEDAVLQGLLEVVERDAVSLWWYNRTSQPAIDLEAFSDPWLTELREVYAGMQREVWALDLTADLGIPTTVALSRRVDKAEEDVMLGFGAHLDPAIALRRAMTEMNQLMPAVIGGYHSKDPDALRWWRTVTRANQPYLSPRPDAPARRPGDYETSHSDDLREDVEDIHGRLREKGLQLLVLDQTRPDIGLPVVKVIVPGMRQFWARFAPGRLFDVPVQLGRLRQQTTYEKLNPFPIFV
jgi:ribosomal protein S12 methylthiotransferase accessory factor